VTDFRYGLRILARNPAFALTAGLSLAIGIGANTTIFTIANALLFARPQAVVDPSRIVDIGGTNGSGRGPFGQISYLNYLDVRERIGSLESVYAYQPVAQPMSLATAGPAVPITGAYVSTNYFAALGVRPAVGRLFDDRDSDRSGGAPVVVLSHRTWRLRFQADSTIAGRTITINGQPHTIVGVAPDGFHGTSILLSDMWVPIETGPARLLENRDLPWPLIGGRLKPGVSYARAAAEVDAIGRELELEFPAENRDRGLRLVPATPIPGNILPVAAFLTLLTAIVSLVLVVACANVAGVLLARASARRREIAVRLALGAGRARLVRQLLAETTTLFMLGGAAGLALARGMTLLVVAMLPALPLPVDVSLPLDTRAVLFTTMLSLAAAVLSGLAPALHTSRAEVVVALKDQSQGPSDRLRLRHAFVIGQIAVSVLLVVGSALFVRALRKASSIDLGFDNRGVEIASLDLGLAGYSNASGQTFTADLIERVRQLPGVATATIASTGDPIGDGRRRGRLSAPGAGASSAPAPDVDWNAVGPQYFATLRIPLIAGRDFSEADRASAPQIAILGEAAAARFFPNLSRTDIVGRTVVLTPAQPGEPRGRSDTRSNSARDGSESRLQVVGIARDVSYFGPREARATAFVYVPFREVPFGSRVTLVARTTHGQRIAADIRSLVASMNPALPILGSQTLEERTAVWVVPQRVAASISGALGLVGVLLAAIGIYGVTTYTVTRRRREIGVRMALGADRADVIHMVLRQGVALAVVGSIAGLALAAAAGRLLASFLLGIAPFDPAIFGGAALLFTLVALVASYEPTRRATRIDPVDALRSE